jgi:hypothetical protein
VAAHGLRPCCRWLRRLPPQVATMLKRATSRSLVIIDEFGKVRCRCWAISAQ